MKLSWTGKEATPEEASMTFNRVAMSYISVLFVAAWLIPIVGVIMIIVFTVYMLFVAVSARKVMRKKFDIPAGPLGEAVEDYCCLFYCPCCTLVQMARHTHDDHEYPGYCCTIDGLELGAPHVI
jgi:Cys-rich protein (TIGR01571 family)